MSIYDNIFWVAFFIAMLPIIIIIYIVLFVIGLIDHFVKKDSTY